MYAGAIQFAMFSYTYSNVREELFSTLGALYQRKNPCQSISITMAIVLISYIQWVAAKSDT